MQLIDPLVVEEVILESARVEPPIQADPVAFVDQPAQANAVAEPEAQPASWERRLPDLDADPASLSSDVPTLVDALDTAEADDDENEFAEEEDEFAEAEPEFWESELSFEVGSQAVGGGVDESPFDSAEFAELPDFDPQEIETETESAQWEDLLELELYDDTAEPSALHVEEAEIADSRQLDDYAARLVSQMRSIKLDERLGFQSRFKAILEEFPFSASYRALSRLVSAGVGIEELEDACALKCLWREAPWLWSHRLFNGMQGAWQTEERSTYRSALSWKLAIDLIKSVGRPEAERKLVEDWLSEWQRMSPEHAGPGGRMDPSFWSYAAYLQLSREHARPRDDDLWYYEELPDRQSWTSLRLQDDDGEIWRFEPKSDGRDTGFLSRLPLAERLAEEMEAERKEAQQQQQTKKKKKREVKADA